MFLTTRCPHCGAAFEVAPDQLQVRRGLVRCGDCGAVFDGRANLVAADSASQDLADSAGTQAEGLAFLHQRAGSDQADQSDESDSAAAADVAPEPPAVLRGRPARVEPSYQGVVGRVAALTQQHEAADPATDADASLDEPEAESDDDDTVGYEPLIVEPNPYARPRAVPEFMDEQAGVRRRRARRWWALACLLALLLLAVQALVVFRVSLAIAMPVLRPTLEALCQPLNCVVSHERRAEQLTVMASSLQPTAADSADPSRLSLSVTLRNRGQHAQPWPALMLDLRDFSDTLVTRRALLPAEYLPPALAGQPLAAGAEVGLSIPLTVSGARVSGYRVTTFHP